MRVLVLTPDFPPAKGGIQLLVHRLAERLDVERLRVVALGSSGARRFDAEGELDVVRVGRKGGRLHRPSVLALNARAVAEGIVQRPQVVISAHVTMSPAAFALRRLTRSRVLQYVHADEFRGRPGLTARAVCGADAVVAVSGYGRSMAIGAGADEARIDVIPPGVDIPARQLERDPTPTVVTVARLVAHKGHETMVRAMPLVLERVPQARWVVVGEGPDLTSLEQLARALGVEGAIEFVGSVDDSERDRWLDRGWVFAMPSRVPPEGVGGEGFGIAYLEAGAHELPVVGPNVGGVPDAVLDGVSGLLVDPLDPAAVAGAVTRLLEDRELAARMGSAGRARAEELSWNRHASRMTTVISRLGEKSSA